jgi:predicted ATPase/class 3 adenylate cyclase
MTSTVTVSTMFTDLVNSTALSSRIGPDAAEALRREHFALLRSAVATSGGEEVKSTGDGVMVVFHSASAAVDAAVAIQQAVDRSNRDSAEPVALRVGIGIGEVEPVDGDYYGPSVVEAARLCGAAARAQILVTELVQSIAAGRGAHSFVSVGCLELKGLPAPIATYEVHWEPVASPGLPVPRRLILGDAPGFFGRDGERRLIKDAFKLAAAGERQLVLISGEPGIGKTRLAAEAADAAHDAGAVVLYGRSDEGLGIPYQPFAEALRHYVEVGPEAVLRAQVDERGGELTRLVPELARRLSGVPPPKPTDPEGERYLLFGAVVALLDQASREAPVLLVLDDLQWADKPSLLLLRHLIVSSDSLPILILAAFQEGELGHDHPLIPVLAAFHRERGVHRVALRGLEDIELQALLAARAGHDLSDDGVAMANRIRRETAGNPFFVTEIVRHLAETGAIQREVSGRWVIETDLDTMSLPQSVREVIGARVARLGETATRVLTLAAVIGRDFELGLLARVSGLEEDQVLDILDAARETALLDDVRGAPDRFMFSHGLIEQALYEDLSRPRRQRAHLRVAEALEELDATTGSRIAELAYHWAQATTPTDAAKAIGYAQRAGDDSLARLAPDEAIRWYHQALDLLDQQPKRDATRRCDLLIGLGTARGQAGDPDHAETLRAAVQAAQELDSPERLVRSVLASETYVQTGGGSFLSPEERRDAIENTRLALAAVRDADGTDRARLLAYLATVSESFSQRMAYAEEAVAIARRIDDRVTLADVLVHAGNAIIAPDTLEQRLQWGAELRRLAEELDNPVTELGAYNILMFALAEKGDFEARSALLEGIDRLAERFPMPFVQQAPMAQRGWDLLLAGRLQELHNFAQQGRAHAERIGYADGFVTWGILEFAARRCAGDHAELIEFLGAIADGLRERLGGAHEGLAAASALIACEVGHADDARPFLEPRVSTKFTHVPYDQSWLSTLNMWSSVAAALGNEPAAAVLYELLGPWHSHVVVLGNGGGGVSHYLGLLATVLGRSEAAEAHFAEALALHDRLAVPFWTVQTRISFSRVLLTLRAGAERHRAAELARQALETASAHGFKGLENQAADLVTDLT